MIALLSSSFVVLILFVLIVLFLHFVPLGLWVSALAAGVNVGIFTLVGMRLLPCCALKDCPTPGEG